MKTTEILSRADLQPAADLFAAAAADSRLWDSMVSAAMFNHGDHGQQISGIGRDHFPESTKIVLRTLARRITALSDAAWAARPARVRNSTMRLLRQAVRARDGGGFYG